MAHLVIGQINAGTDVSTKDAISVSDALTKTSSFKNTISDPEKREEFLRALESRKELALASNNTQMFSLLGNLYKAAKDASYAPKDTGSDLYGDRTFMSIG